MRRVGAFRSQMGGNELPEEQLTGRKATWWRRSTAHGLEVLGSRPTKVRWGSQGIPGRGSAGVLGRRVTVRTDFGPRRLRRFPGCFVESSLLVTERHAWGGGRDNRSNPVVSQAVRLLFQLFYFHVTGNSAGSDKPHQRDHTGVILQKLISAATSESTVRPHHHLTVFNMRLMRTSAGGRNGSQQSSGTQRSPQHSYARS